VIAPESWLLTKPSGSEPTVSDFAADGHVESGTKPCWMNPDAAA
jgi:hypothetical protein